MNKNDLQVTVHCLFIKKIDRLCLKYWEFGKRTPLFVIISECRAQRLQAR